MLRAGVNVRSVAQKSHVFQEYFYNFTCLFSVSNQYPARYMHLDISGVPQSCKVHPSKFLQCRSINKPDQCGQAQLRIIVQNEGN